MEWNKNVFIKKIYIYIYNHFNRIISNLSTRYSQFNFSYLVFSSSSSSSNSKYQRWEMNVEEKVLKKRKSQKGSLNEVKDSMDIE